MNCFFLRTEKNDSLVTKISCKLHKTLTERGKNK